MYSFCNWFVICQLLPLFCPWFDINAYQVAKRWNEPSSVNPNFSSSPQNSFSLLFRSVYLGGDDSEVLAFFQGLLTSEVSIIIIVVLFGLYRISGFLISGSRPHANTGLSLMFPASVRKFDRISNISLDEQLVKWTIVEKLFNLNSWISNSILAYPSTNELQINRRIKKQSISQTN